MATRQEEIAAEQAAAVIARAARASAGGASGAGSSSAGSATPATPATPAAPTAGGTPPPSTPTGSGGSGGGGSSGRSFDWLGSLRAIAALFALIGATIFYVTDARPNRTKLEEAGFEKVKEQEKTKQMEETTKQMRIAARTGQPVPMPAPSAVASPPVVAPVVPQDPVVLRTFSCVTREERDEGFKKNQIQRAQQPGTQYRITSGCAWIKLDVYVKSLVGHGYVFREEVTPGNFRGCGDIDGVNFTLRQCTDYINSRRGEAIQVVVEDGGEIILN